MKKNLLKLVVLFAILSLYSCSTKKIRKEYLSKLDTVNQRLQAEQKKTYALTFEYVKLRQMFSEHLRNDSIKANNSSNNYDLKNSLIRFPNPPPLPSAKYLFSNNQIKKLKTFNDVNQWLVENLNRSGYKDKLNYFLFDDGFVVVTDLEQIDNTAKSLPSPQRWKTTPVNSFKDEWSLKQYINRLFNAQPGLYRSIAFVVSPSLNTFSPNDYSKELYAKFLNQGSIGLPIELGKSYLKLGTKITALIYEFKKPENSNETMLVTDGLSGSEHLKRALILKN